MASNEEETILTAPTEANEENEPPQTSEVYKPYTTEEDKKKVAGNDTGIDSSEEATSPLIGSKSRKISSSSIPIDLNNRETRLTIWSIAYFIFCICEFSANIILSEQNSNPKSAYQTWAASDFFLLLGASLLFIECNPTYILDDIRGNQSDMHKILRYIICGLFVFGGFLRFIALGKHNSANCNDSHCTSWHFAQDFMATWFSFVIGCDVINLFEMIKMEQVCLRLVIYTILMIILSIIVISYYDYLRSNYNAINASETGWFFILFMLLIILIIAILVCLNKYGALVSDDKTRKYVHFGIALVLNIGIGLAYYSSAVLFHTVLAIVALLIITFDFIHLS